MQADIEIFKKARNEALQSLDKEKIIAFMNRYKIPYSKDEQVFWASIHKARTACVNLPQAEIDLSKKWLSDRNLSSLD